MGLARNISAANWFTLEAILSSVGERGADCSLPRTRDTVGTNVA